MKLRAPQGCASICHDGRIFVVADDGSIDVPKAIAATLDAHGFTPWADADAVPDTGGEIEAEDVEAPRRINVATLTRAELFAFLRERGASASRRDTNVKLRATARSVLKAQAASKAD
jgi:hypothetical protein